MGRRLPRHTARKSTGERRLPDKTNNTRDSSEDGSEVVRGKRPAAGGGDGAGGQPPEDGWPAAPCNNSLRLDIEDSHAIKKGKKSKRSFRVGTTWHQSDSPLCTGQIELN